MLDLPTELLEYILDYVDPLDKKTFYQLALVNKTVNRLATPRLYRAVDFKDPSIRRPGMMLRRFVVTILSSKERASLVREFEITSELPFEKAYFPADSTAKKIETLVGGFAPESLVRQATETFTMAIVDSYMGNHRFELLQLFAAVCLPNLTRLAFEGFSNPRIWDLMDAVLDSFAADESALPGVAVWPVLEEVAIEGMQRNVPTAHMRTHAQGDIVRRRGPPPHPLTATRRQGSEVHGLLRAPGHLGRQGAATEAPLRVRAGEADLLGPAGERVQQDRVAYVQPRGHRPPAALRAASQRA